MKCPAKLSRKFKWGESFLKNRLRKSFGIQIYFLHIIQSVRAPKHIWETKLLTDDFVNKTQFQEVKVYNRNHQLKTYVLLQWIKAYKLPKFLRYSFDI